jgi:hypothetical protein
MTPAKKKPRQYGHISGARADLFNIAFRSKWEANIARWLEHLKASGSIQEWDYEPREFKFPVKRGAGGFYKPDFRVAGADGSVEWWEIKAYMDAVSKTKLKRMKKYFPEEAVLVINKESYLAIERDACKIIEGWE